MPYMTYYYVIIDSLNDRFISSCKKLGGLFLPRSDMTQNDRAS